MHAGLRRHTPLSSSPKTENEQDRHTISGPATEHSTGLTSADARLRLETYGYNEIPEERRSAIRQFAAYFWGPIPWMIEVAALLSVLVQHWADLAIILTLLFVNAGVGFWEEFQAGNAIAALKQKLALRARVKRDGKWTTIAAREIVPGDVVRLRIGDVIPADGALLPGDAISVDQSALTGESLPVSRKPGDTVYSGSIIRQGEIDATVTATGSNTYFGKTAKLVESAHTVSHFQRAVLKIGNYLIVIAVTLALVILAISIVRGDRLVTTLEFALILTVAAIPVAMPTVLSVTMAVGARVLARNEAIVSRLASIEELAGMNILCSDKTGTLTKNQLTLGDPYCLPGKSPQDLILSAALASREEDEDPIDQAVLQSLESRARIASYKIEHFLPFDPVSKRTEATVQGADCRRFTVSKGAPQVILELAHASDGVRQQVESAVNGFAARGFRSLGVASTQETGTWQVLGVLPLFDPPREDSRNTIETAQNMGIDIKMLTGDQLAIAREIAQQLGLGTNIQDARVLDQIDLRSDSAAAELIGSADGFAQVFPEHKFRIVETLQKTGDIVGMTGDGVNDAPPLKQADAGIAVSGATDAARAAADIVLLTPGLSVIIDAIKESRKIFQRMNSYAIYRIAETIRVLLFLTLSITVFNFYPVTAIMIVLLAVLNDAAIISIAYDNVHYSDKPEVWDMRRVLTISTVLGIAGVIASFTLFALAERVFNLDRDTIQTLMYLKLSVAGQLTIFVTRTRGPFWSIKPAPILLGAVAGAQTIAVIVSVSGVLMAPLPWKWVVFVWVYALVWFLFNDRVKLLTFRVLDARRSLIARATNDSAGRQTV